ncbi:MAG TPA: energy transducer TonB, partial [Thermoanaerobaculia bacterium]|nr:energy transducer TonB [Thermoanaerobaculia bacterium]
MFETSVVKARAVAAERRFGLLSASIFAHSFIGVALIVSSLSATNFPTHAPNQLELFRAVQIPPIPIQKGDPNGGAKQPQQKASMPPQQKPAQQTAPQTTPDTVPTPPQQPSSSSPSTDTNPTLNPGGEGEGPGLVPGPVGDPRGIEGGLPIQPEVATPPAAVLRPGGDVKPATVLYRVSPSYPPTAARAGINGVVVVECIIGSDGLIRDPRVVRSSFAAFNQPAIDAVSQWRFAPGTLHGHPVDTYFEL